MKNIFLFIIILFFSLNGFSDSKDSLIYNSEFEKSAFSDFEKDSTIDALRFFCSIDYTEGVYKEMNSKIDKMISEMKTAGIEKKSLKKKVKIIYKKVHSTLFKKYQENIAFNEILKSGTYNCVTATAVYAMVLDRFNISYDIMERPNHAYIIINQDNENILMESTNPQSGIIRYDENYQKNYVKYLHDIKIISDEEFINKGIKELFKTYYSNDEVINLYELAALHYNNKGIEYIEKEIFDKASNTLSKAYKLFSSNTKIRYTYNASLSLLINQQSINNSYKASTLADFLRVNIDDESMHQKMEQSFSYIISDYAIEKSEIENSKSFYYEFIGKFSSDTINLDEYKFSFFTTAAYYYFVEGKYKISLLYSDSAYTLFPDNMKAKAFVQDNLSKIIYEYFQDDDNLEDRFDEILDYFIQFQFMKDYKQYRDVYFYLLFGRVDLAYEDEEIELGHEFLMECETEYKNMDMPVIKSDTYGNAFRELSYYYGNNKGIDSLEQIFARWHKLIPDYNYLVTEPKAVRKGKYKPVKYTPVYDYEKVVADEKKAKLYKAEEYKKLFKKTFTGGWESKEYRLAGTKDIIKGKTVKLISKKRWLFQLYN